MEQAQRGLAIGAPLPGHMTAVLQDRVRREQLASRGASGLPPPPGPAGRGAAQPYQPWMPWR